MIIILQPGADEAAAREILDQIADAGLKPLHMPGSERTVLGAIGDERVLQDLHLESYPQVERVTPVLTPYKLVSREAHKTPTVVHVGGVPVGGPRLAIIAGPCAVESLEQMNAAADAVLAAGGHALRGGAFKPRSSPYSFQGLGTEGLRILRTVSARTGLPAVTEVVDVADVDEVAKHADAFQVGARNMQNFRLLTALGHQTKPVVLKRGMSARLEDLLLAAEYIVSEGNSRVILCERGIRTFETAMRNTLDLSAVPYLKCHTHLPVLVDPSHGTGMRELVSPMAKAAIACGADGLLVEVHQTPKEAVSDGQQSLTPEEFHTLMVDLAPVAAAVGRTM